jgi:2-desacetyl-2-hydroxyethyl bacteriochlorophyllide A dehydrogenase
MTARELWFAAPGRVELREATLAALRPAQVRACALASGISQGTELLLYRGEGPEPFDPSLDAPGAPTYPRRYGYAWVGEVTESHAPELAPGARVFALAPHGDTWATSASGFRALEPEIPAERAVLSANCETAVNVVWDSGVALGDHVVVLGGGVVGLLCGYLAKLAGARQVTLVEPSARRRAAATQLGFDAALPPDQGPEPGVADLAIEATGNPACLDQAITCLRHEGVVCVASFYGQRVAKVALGSDFHRKRLTLRASQVSHVPPAQRGRWSLDRRFELVRELLRDSALDALLEPSVSFADAPAVYDGLATAPAERLQVVFHYAR